MKKLMCCMVLFVAGSWIANAQTALYGAVSASNFNVPDASWQYGSNFGIYYDHWGVPFVRAGLDLRGSLLGSGDTQLDSGFIGPRVQLHPHVLPLMPYVEALLGMGRLTVGKGAYRQNDTNFEYRLVGGLDMTIFPRLDWRVVDYSWGEMTGTSPAVRPSTLSTGLVLRLP